MKKIIYLYFKDSKIKTVKEKRRERIIKGVLSDKFIFHFIGNVNKKSLQEKWILNRIGETILKNKHYFIAKASKEMIKIIYKDKKELL